MFSLTSIGLCCGSGRFMGVTILLIRLSGTMLGLPAMGAAAQSAAVDSSTKSMDKVKSKDETSTTKASDVPAAGVAVDPDAYRIGLSDQLMISVWKEPELSMTVVVRPDGMITLPLINDLRVVGLKPIELQQLLSDKLKGFVSEPQVTVIVQGIRSRKAYLVGNVSKQGSYPLEGGETVLQLLAASGGVNQFAKADSIYILRTENNKQVRIPFQYKKALKGRAKDDLLLLPGDIVVVP